MEVGRKESAVQQLVKRFSLVALAAITVAATVTQARQAFQTMAVSTRVSPSATFGLELAAQSLKIDAADLERGYVDVVMKSRLGLPNARGASVRPAIAMALEAPPANGNGHGHSKTAATARIVENASQGETGELRYRFEFSREASEGRAGAIISVSVDL